MTEQSALAKLDTHEAVCAERYEGINERLGRMEKILIGACGGLIMGMFGLIVTLAMHTR